MFARIIILFALLAMTCNLTATKDKKVEDKTLSPYFFVKCDDPTVDQLPLLETSANVNIAGVIADVTVRQVYKNAGKKPLEAVYIFPGSTRAAVYEMTMTIGERILKAEIQKKEEARKMYEVAKSEGKTASLLEQQRPNVFQMNIANILPGDTIIVEMKYTELLIPEDNRYEFVYPTVVGPRYTTASEGTAPESEKFTNTPYQKEGEKPLYKFNFSSSINAGMPIAEIYSNSHKMNITKNEDCCASIMLDPSETNAGNKDLIINYGLCGSKILTGLLLQKGEKENFFCLMVQPPKQVQKKDIPKREYIFIMDVSGSMHGFPLDISKVLINKLLSNLNPNDMFNILFFSGGANFLSCNSLPATNENIQKAKQMMSNFQGSGGTELLPALQKVMRFPKTEGYSRSIAIFTDGYVSVETQAFELIRNNLDKSNFFAFGIGSSVNRFLIEGIAKAGQGLPFIAVGQKEANEVADKFLKYINSPVMTDIKVEYDGFAAYDINPVSIPDVLSERPIIIYGKYRDDAAGTIHISGVSGNEKLKLDIPVLKFASFNQSQALKYLWARNKITEISDYKLIDNNPKAIEEVTNLGLKYNLLTNYTSFIAIDYVKRNNDSLVMVKQPLPLPEGVSNLAVGEDKFASTPQPAPQYRKMSSGKSKTSVKVDKKQSVDYAINDALSGEYDYEEGRGVEVKDYEGLQKIIANLDTVLAVDKAATFDTDMLLKKLKYPEERRLDGVDTTVIIRVMLGDNGVVYYLKLISDSTYTSRYSNYKTNNPFVEKAIQAVKEIQFKPATKNGKVVHSFLDVKVEFNIDSYEPNLISQGEMNILSNGVHYMVIQKGSGKKLKKGDKAVVYFIMAEEDDCNETKNIPFRKVAKTFKYRSNDFDINIQDGMLGMQPGEKRNIYIPREYHYPKTDYINYSKQDYVIFEVELLRIEGK